MSPTTSARYSQTMLDLDQKQPGGLRYLRREEFDRMVEAGLFQDERVELLEGLLVSMSPSGAPHMEATSSPACIAPGPCRSVDPSSSSPVGRPNSVPCAGMPLVR